MILTQVMLGTNPLGGVRVFPDARAPNFSTPKDKVNIKVTLVTDCPKPTEIFLRAFDVDDPSPDTEVDGKLMLDPNDKGVGGDYDGGTGLTYSIEEDNRGDVQGNKFGYSNGMDDGIFPITFAKDADVSSLVEFQVSQHAGDNYRLAGYADKAFLKAMRNFDKEDGIEIKHLAKATVKDLLEIEKVQSKVLTVWRLLHLEYDIMSPPNANENIIKGVIREFQINSASGLLTAMTINVTEPLITEGVLIDKNNNGIYTENSPGNLYDGSPATDLFDDVNQPDNYYSNGRFENGKISIGENGYVPFLNISVKKNGKDYITLTNDINYIGVLCRLKDLNGVVLGTAKIKKLTVTSNSSGNLVHRITLESFLPASLNLNLVLQISIGSAEHFVFVNAVSNNTKTVDVVDLGIPFSLIDDDNDLMSQKEITLSQINDAYRDAFLVAVNDGGGNPSNNQSSAIPWQSNIRHIFNNEPDAIEDWEEIEDYRQSKQESSSYWVAYCLNGFQGDFHADNDPKDEINFYNGIFYAWTTNPDATEGIDNKTIARGFDLASLFREVIQEYNHSPTQSYILAHEIGHQFGLSHGDYKGKIQEYLDDKMGLMTAKFSPSNTKLIKRHINLIRSRVESPGKN